MMKIRLFIHDRLTELQKYMDFGLPKTIERPIICLPVTVFYSIMNPLEEEKPL